MPCLDRHEVTFLYLSFNVMKNSSLLLIVLLSPSPHAFNNHAKALSPFSQGIFNTRRNLWIYLSCNYTLFFQIPQSARECFRADADEGLP